MCLELEEHIAMVFHRYLAGEAGRRKLRIAVNGNAVRPWDPFVREEKGTRSLDPITLHFNHEGAEGEILIEPFVLPHQEAFSSAAAHAAAAGPLRWNRQQGFYIYRAGRMIQSGGWSNLRTMDEHTKLARVALSFDPRLDEAFRINVAKMRVQLPRQLREQIEKAIARVIKTAQAAYRRSNDVGQICETSRERSKAISAIAQSGNTPRAAETASKTATNRKPAKPVIPIDLVPRNKGDGGLWTIQQLQHELGRVATIDERPIVLGVLERFLREQDLPTDLTLTGSVADHGSADQHCDATHFTAGHYAEPTIFRPGGGPIDGLGSAKVATAGCNKKPKMVGLRDEQLVGACLD
jgi:hypothetical protein